MTRPTIGDTIELMTHWHEGQVDKAGKPYYLHPLRVMMRLTDPTDAMRHAALLHDVVEDTPTTLYDLQLEGYPVEVLDLVDLLTRRKKEPYDAYIDRLLDARNTPAAIIKLADIADNTAPNRLWCLSYEQQEFTSHRLAATREKILTALPHLLTSSGRLDSVREGDF